MRTRPGSCARNAAPRRRFRDDAGLSLIELVVALTVFALLAGGVASLVDSGLSLARNNRNRSVAANLASQEMDLIRTTDFADLPLGQSASTQTVDGFTYTLTRDTEWVPVDATTSPCNPDNLDADPELLRVQVLVTWPNMRGVAPVESTTVLTPPVGVYDVATGHVGVIVRDRNAEPTVANLALPDPPGGIPVRLTGPGGYDETIETTTAGCAFFAFLDPGSYTVSVSASTDVAPVPVMVDRQGNPNPNQAVGVDIGTTISTAFDYDHAATLAVDLVAPDGGTVPSGALPLTIANAALLPGGTQTVAGSGTSRLIPNLFPYLSGYSVWAGECADADPEGVDGSAQAYWPDQGRPDPITTTPGATNMPAAPVTLWTVDVDVYSFGVPEPGVAVTATHLPDPGCGSGATLTLGVSDAGGQVRGALPFGTWELEASGATTTVVVDPAISGVVFASDLDIG